MRRKKLINTFLYCLLSIAIMMILAKSEGDTQVTSEGATAEPTDEAIEASVNQQSIYGHIYEDNVDLYIKNNQVNDKVISYENKYYVPLSIIERFLNGKVDVTSLLETVSIFHEDNQFQLPLITSVMLEQLLLDHHLNEKATDLTDYYVVLVGEEPYVSLSFIENELEYLVNVKEQDNLIITIEEEKAELPLDLPLINQMDSPRLYNGCEVTSLTMILQYHGIDVTKNELADEIATVPLTYNNGLKGNPNEGFVGNMADGPGLGVNHQPMVELAQKYVGERALDITGAEPETMYDYLDKGLPVWIITTVDFSPVANFETWKTPSGEIEVTFSVHSVAVTGYEEEYVYVNDPYGMKNRKVDRNNFELAWEQMGKQAIVIME